MSTGIDKIAVTEFIRRYSGDFKVSTIANMGQYFCEQVTTVHDDEINQYDSSAEFLKSITESLMILVGDGFSHTVLDEIHIHPLRENSIFVSANFSRLTSKNSLIAKVGASYVLVQSKGNFKISVILGHDYSNLIR